jgi:hypothetical protein
MLKTIIIAAVLCLAAQTQAQTLRVTKVKGNKAVVDIVKGRLTEGQTVTAGSDELDFGSSTRSSNSGTSSTGPRGHFVGGTGSFSMAKPAGSSSTLTSINANALYGWNPGNQMEYGGILSFGSTSGGTGGSSTSFAGGGKFDYDFTNNKAPVEGIISAGAEATIGSASTGNGGSVSQITVFPMASYKYFILGTPTCVRADAGLKFVQSSGSGNSTSETNPAVNIGLFTYF